jgi:transposase-like protein
MKDLKTFINDLKNIDPKDYWPVKESFNKLDLKKIVTLILEDGDTVKCGHCGSLRYTKNGRKNDLQRYKCKSCGKNFNQLTGTPLARLRKKGRWLNYCQCLSNGLSIRESATTVKVSIKTSFKWRHKFLINANNSHALKLNGIAEAKETYFKYSEKGSPEIQHPEKIGQKIFVLTTLDRNRNTTTPIIKQFKTSTIHKQTQNLIAEDCRLYTNKNNCFINSAKLNNFKHHIAELNFRKDSRYIHIKNANSYNFDLHCWMKRFRGVATKYLHNYLSWYREIDEYNQEIPAKVLLVRGKSLERYPYLPLSKTMPQKE